MPMNNMVVGFEKVKVPHEDGYRIVAVLDAPVSRRRSGGSRVVETRRVTTGVEVASEREADRICMAWTELVAFKNAMDDVETIVGGPHGAVDREGVMIEEI